MAIRTETRGTTGIITIDRAEARNAINRDVAQGIEDALDGFEVDPEVRVVVVTGTGDTFSAGADLRAVTSDPMGMVTERGGFAGIVRREYPKTLIAAVNGRALGGGFEIALACHLVVAAEEATFGLPEVRRGLVAAAGGLVRLGQRLPRAIALELVMTGASITAAEAHTLGLVNRVVPADELLDSAVALGEAVSRNSPTAVRISRAVVTEARTASDLEGWALTDRAVGELQTSEDFAEGIAAFLEKREPRWSSL